MPPWGICGGTVGPHPPGPHPPPKFTCWIPPVADFAVHAAVAVEPGTWAV